MVYGQLHQLIEQSKWNEALLALRAVPAVQSDASETHRDDLPLHMACDRRAPDDVIVELLKHNPSAVKHVGRGGNLPLHIATQRNLSYDVVETIIRAYPAALDCRNSSNYTPRDFGHDDQYAFQGLSRPTACWHQLMTDEKREEAQDTKLHTLHESIDAALTALQKSNDNFDDMTSRLDHVEKTLQDLENLRAQDLEGTITKLETSISDSMQKIENRLSTVEDDVKAAAARDFMARAASRAHQSDVAKMQKSSAEEVKRLQKEVEQLRVHTKIPKNAEKNVSTPKIKSAA
uniref:Uncharacterized protein n=2 Tax=Ditylum brightwellii TaxID=49249 RepID=A0A7S4SVK9_9STRA|mmetsp:Transcript_25064/g.37461  ORF Transcript_25064/g.37461 Transcript_25064/m.37461 type:complete len:290 (+) Transcript_25064:56-925(+)